jgi:putative acetyltransferase
MKVTVRHEQVSDANIIREVTQDAFRGQQHTCGREAAIVDRLRDAGALSVSLVAEVEDRIVGHVAASPVDAEPGQGVWYGIGPLSVSPEFQRQGIGATLMNAALARLREMGAHGCVLVGHPGYYGRFGFAADGAAIVEGAPREVTFCLKFIACGNPGRVRFHAAFGVH